MNKIKEKDEKANSPSELIGAIADSFHRNQTERLRRLEGRLGWLSTWATYAIIIALAYLGYQIWIDLRTELDVPAGPRAIVYSPAADRFDDSRSSIFILFAIALGGPVLAVAGYLILGFIYNVLHDVLVHRIPLARFVVVPALLMMVLIGMDTHRVQLKSSILDGYAAVQRRIASANYIRQQAHESAKNLQQIRQAEQELNESDANESAADDAAISQQEDTQNSTAQSQDTTKVPPEEAVRQMSEMMEKLQNMLPAEDDHSVKPAQPSSPPLPGSAPNQPTPPVNAPSQPTPPENVPNQPTPPVSVPSQPTPAGT